MKRVYIIVGLISQILGVTLCFIGDLDAAIIALAFAIISEINYATLEIKESIKEINHS